ncbi:MAG: porin [Gemmatimonadota bacterium]
MHCVVRRIALVSAFVVAGASPALAQNPNVTVNGVVYSQFAYQLKKDSVTDSHLNNFDVTRAYINVLGKFPAGVGTRVTADIYRISDGSLSYRLKYAYVTYTPDSSHITLKFGQVQTPWVDFEEALWDYRMQGTVALDRNKYLSSSDFGAAVDGSWGFERLNLSAGVYNGENYNGGTGDQRKDVMARASFRLMETNLAGRVGGLRLTGYAQTGKPTGGGERQRIVGMLSYKSKRLTLAGEYAATKDSNTSVSVAQVNGQVISGFAVLNIPNTRFALIGRVDIVDPNKDVSGSDKLTRFIAGASYMVSPNLRVLADIDNLSREDNPSTNSFNATRSQALFQLEYKF